MTATITTDTPNYVGTANYTAKREGRSWVIQDRAFGMKVATLADRDQAVARILIEQNRHADKIAAAEQRRAAEQAGPAAKAQPRTESHRTPADEALRIGRSYGVNGQIWDNA